MAELPARIAPPSRCSCLSPATMATPEKPQILLLCLEYRDFLDESYEWLFTKLLEVARVQRVKTATAALRVMSENSFRAIIIADEGLAQNPKFESKQVSAKIKAYIEDGGLAIVGLHFPCFAHMDSICEFFKAFGLPWSYGDYYRTTFQLNPAAELPGDTAESSFPELFNMKALHVRGARVQEKTYIAEVDGMTKSRVFTAEYVDRSQAAVAAANIGQGYLVYCGDVNGEHESSRLILAICGFEVETD